MKNIYLFLVISTLLTFGCTKTQKTPEEALVGQWKDRDSTYYFGDNGEFVFISPIGGYFKGDYEIVAQDPADKMVEIKTTDKIPGYTKYFHRRFKGKLSEDDQKFNGDNLSSYPKTMPVSLEYIDNSQAPSSDVIERVLEISYKKLGEAETAMVNNFNNLEEARENAKFETKRHTAEIKELKLQIEKLQTQIEQLRAQLKEKEQDISTPKSTNNE